MEQIQTDMKKLCTLTPTAQEPLPTPEAIRSMTIEEKVKWIQDQKQTPPQYRLPLTQPCLFMHIPDFLHLNQEYNVAVLLRSLKDLLIQREELFDKRHTILMDNLVWNLEALQTIIYDKELLYRYSLCLQNYTVRLDLAHMYKDHPTLYPRLVGDLKEHIYQLMIELYGIIMEPVQSEI
jgi:hypothetical protein